MFKNKEVKMYVITLMLLCVLITSLSYGVGKSQISIVSVLTPSLVALAMVMISDGQKGVKALFVDQLVTPFGWGWFLVALAVFPVVGIAAVGLHGMFGGPSLGLRTTQLLPQVIVILVISLGEEFGWRGYLLPKLQEKYSALVASLILGLVWGVWHFPASLIGTGVPQNMPFLVFMAWVLVATILMTWVYNNTGSVLLAIIMHSAANATFNYLPLLPEFVGQLNTFIFFLVGVSLLSGVVVWYFGPRNLLVES
jgi:membrane protease YdiL (CAAX protease family)